MTNLRLGSSCHRGLCHDTIRPHQALGYLTPAEWLVRHGYPPGPV